MIEEEAAALAADAGGDATIETLSSERVDEVVEELTERQEDALDDLRADLNRLMDLVTGATVQLSALDADFRARYDTLISRLESITTAAAENVEESVEAAVGSQAEEIPASIHESPAPRHPLWVRLLTG